MSNLKTCRKLFMLSFLSLALSSCAYNSANENDYSSQYADNERPEPVYNPQTYAERMPQNISGSGAKQIVIDPNVHAWGAYNAQGELVKGGLATAGAGYCPDLGRSCRTKVGVFHVYSLGSPGCKSSKFPLPRGGAPMPFCMFFHGGQALHGSYEAVPDNVSHGCVRLKVEDAKWLRYDFVNVGTKVTVKPY